MNTLQKSLCSLVIAGTLIALYSETVQAGSATWKGVPDTGDWNNLDNWSAGGPPNGSADTATFGISTLTALFLSANTEVNGVTFNADASAYTISVPASGNSFALTISGTGITNNSGVTQNFVTNGGGIDFRNSATAGNQMSYTNNSAAGIRFFDTSKAGNSVFTNNPLATGIFGTEFHDSSSADHGTFINMGSSGPLGTSTSFWDNATAGNGTFINNAPPTYNGSFPWGSTRFHNNATAGNGIFINNGGAEVGAAGITEFFDTSSAGTGTFINNGGLVAGNYGGLINFDGSTAADGTFINNGSAVSGGAGGTLVFYGGTAGNATLIANGGSNGGGGGRIEFLAASVTGGTSRIEVFGNGSLSLFNNGSIPQSVTVGSIEGDGNVSLGASNLATGSNNLSTLFSGVIQDAGHVGSLTKIGTGTLTLSGVNTYTGATTVNAGRLIINGSITSAVTVNGGTLGGSGTTGAITVNKEGVLSPGNSPGILNVNGNLKLALGSTYLVDLDGTVVGTEYDRTNVSGMVDLGSATLSLNLTFTPIAGTAFKIIDNDLSDPVTGTFNGFSEGATFAADGHLFTINYHGGDGNDVVLNAVPEPQTWIFFIVGAISLMIARKKIFNRSSD